MRKIIGFALFFIALGMVLVMLLPSTVVEIMTILICLLLSYNLFFC